MISISETRVGDNKPAIRLNNRIITKDEYEELSKDKDKADLMFLLGITDKQGLKDHVTFMDRVFKEKHKAPNPIAKSTIAEIDTEIKRLQDAKKKLKGAK